MAAEHNESASPSPFKQEQRPRNNISWLLNETEDDGAMQPGAAHAPATTSHCKPHQKLGMLVGSRATNSSKCQTLLSHRPAKSCCLPIINWYMHIHVLKAKHITICFLLRSKHALKHMIFQNHPTMGFLCLIWLNIFVTIHLICLYMPSLEGCN